MDTKVNIKARIKRHSQLLKEDLTNIHPVIAFYRKMSYRLVIITFVIVLPIYPVFSNFIYATSKFDFYRWNIDTSSILESYVDTELSEWYGSTDNWFIIVNAPLDDDRDRDWVNEIIDYVVEEWDTFDAISKKFQISANSIYWANNFAFNKNLEVWETIKVPSISWLVHQVQKRETLENISSKYWISKDKIIAQNNIKAENLSQWMTLIIPWARKYVSIPKAASSWKKWWYSFANSIWKSGQSKDVNTLWAYKLVKRTPTHRFARWNCTYFVAQYKDVTWGWNAKDWLRNAKKAWVTTWTNPWIGSIVVFHWRWYNPRYGHVAIVVDVTKDDIIIKDMNYRRLNEVTTREIPKTDKAIIWYIYAK